SEVVTTSHIQESLQYTQPAITQALKKLVKKKLIDFKSDEIDKRKKLFYLTGKGQEVHQKMIPLWEVMDIKVKELVNFSPTNLMEHITQLESRLNERSLSTAILEDFQLQIKV
ncbi:MAG: MarR family transcriptional regulator, partial [Bacteroidota bacterium]